MAKGEYNYEEDGPDSWFLHYDQCAGSMQSPINIQSASASYSSSLKPFTFNNYSQSISWNIANNGDSSKKFYKSQIEIYKLTKNVREKFLIKKLLMNFLI